LGSYLLDANRGVGQVDLFFAQEANKVSEPRSDDLEEQELVLVTQEQLITAVLQGEFQILPWSAAIALSLLKNLVEDQ
jgi:ADP-ribose pyrophosphatase